MDTSSRAVTVVVPTAHRLEPLRLTLGSILAQDDVDLGVIVVDDAADPATAAYLDRLDDDRVELRRHERPLGAASARNTGLDAVETPWVAFCDDDDLWAPSKLAEQVAAAERQGAAWACTGAVSIDESDRIVDHQRLRQGGDILDAILESNVIPGGGSSVLARTDLVHDAGGFDPSTPASEDWDLWIRLAERSPIAAVDEPFVGYRIWEGSKSRNTDRLVRAFDTIEQRYCELRRRRGVEANRAGHRRWVAKQQLRSRDRLGASSTFLELARGGDPAHWARAAAALTAPRLMDRIGTNRAARQVPAEWCRTAERWLAGIRPADRLPRPQPTG